MIFPLIFLLVAVVAGAIAFVAGFGVGSLLTPFLAIRTGTKVAVAAVSVPHLIASAIRFWMLRKHLDKSILLSFGITSAAGGLLGALLHSSSTSTALHILLAVLLIFAGGMGLLGWAGRLRFPRKVAWIAGAVSGMLGGLVGNQGGIRSAAMLGLDVPRENFVATATAIALFVDAARMSVYLAVEARDVLRIWPLVVVATIGVLLGTFLGQGLLKRIPENVFHRVVGGLIFVLGVAMLARFGR